MRALPWMDFPKARDCDACGNAEHGVLKGLAGTPCRRRSGRGAVRMRSTRHTRISTTQPIKLTAVPL